MTGLKILVTDGEQRSALATVRAAGAAGHAVYVCSGRTRSLAGASRFCRGEASVPDPLGAPREFGKGVSRLMERWSVDMLLPMTEASLLALLCLKTDLGDERLPFPSEEQFRRISNKALVGRAAEAEGIRVPTVLELNSPSDLVGAQLQDLPFPIYVKPASSIVEVDGRRFKISGSYVSDPDVLISTLSTFPAESYPLLLQRRIVGPGRGIFLLVWAGEILAAFGHQRIREKPPAGGVSVYRERVAADPALIRRCASLLRRFDWNGVAMIELKIDAASETPYLMEVNGRLWGSLQLAIEAGVDFPNLLIAAATGRLVEPVTSYALGVRCRWEWGEVDHLIARIFRSRRDLNLTSDAPARLALCYRILADTVRGDTRNEVFKLTDPRPFVQETVDWLRRR